MVELIVAAVILIIIMLVFVFFLFKNILKRMNDNAKKYFVNKMQNYDYIIEEKRNELNDLKKQIEEIQGQQKNIVRKDDEVKIVKRQTKSQDEFIEVQFELKTPKFREEDFFKNYKELKRIFSVDNEEIIKKFVKKYKNVKEEKEYNSLKKVRKKFDENAIYESLILDKKDQMDIMSEVLTDSERKLIRFEEMKKKYGDFSISDLIKFIDERMDEIDLYIYIYMNVVDNKYSQLDKNIVIKQYNNMSEGIIIKYRNKIYDYSI